MSMELLFASQNAHKVEEVRKLIPEGYTLLGLHNINWNIDIPEPYFTYEENAAAKVSLIFEKTGIKCFADDSGLEVEALQGRPGVLSARYAGANRNSVDNMMKVLNELGHEFNRRAWFYSVIAYITGPQQIQIFKGVIQGQIGYKPQGKGGFGYDPIFIPDGFSDSFGALPRTIKGRISHRAIAMKKFIYFLENNK